MSLTPADSAREACQAEAWGAEEIVGLGPNAEPIVERPPAHWLTLAELHVRHVRERLAAIAPKNPVVAELGDALDALAHLHSGDQFEVLMRGHP